MEDLLIEDSRGFVVKRNAKGGRYSSKTRLLTRDLIDRRCRAAQDFDRIARSIAADLGGADQLSTVQKHLVEAFAGISIVINDLNARLLLGQKIDVLEHSQAISTMVRVASRVGINKIPRDVTPPSVAEYLRSNNKDQRSNDSDQRTNNDDAVDAVVIEPVMSSRNDMTLNEDSSDVDAPA
jgi:hypothetical protein